MKYKHGNMVLCKEDYYVDNDLLFKKGKYYRISVANIPNTHYDLEYDLEIYSPESNRVVGFDFTNYKIDVIIDHPSLFHDFFYTKQEERKLKLDKIENVI